jgi:asparagine synthase (glutamine-hydrolysing)
MPLIPLYYTQTGNVFLFGSEIKAILKHPAYSTALDKEALLEYFTFQNFFTDRTLFANVCILPAGTYMRVSPLLSQNHHTMSVNMLKN